MRVAFEVTGYDAYPPLDRPAAMPRRLQWMCLASTGTPSTVIVHLPWVKKPLARDAEREVDLVTLAVGINGGVQFA